MLMTPIKIVGGAFAAVALFAGISVWFATGVTHAAWVDAHRRATRVRQPTPFSDRLGSIATVVIVCIVLHVIAWLMKVALTRREQSIGMSAQFWKVLSMTAYVVGFAGGALIYFTAPE